jgi:hypothetical protein
MDHMLRGIGTGVGEDGEKHYSGVTLIPFAFCQDLQENIIQDFLPSIP